MNLRAASFLVALCALACSGSSSTTGTSSEGGTTSEGGGSDAPADGSNPQGCPLHPSPGTACSQANLSCTYGCIFCNCTNGQWSCAAAACNSGDSGPPPADGPFPCGPETCTAAQLCVHRCGGSDPACVPPDDAGVCPGDAGMGVCTGANRCEIIPGPPPACCVDSFGQASCSNGGAGIECPSPTQTGHDVHCNPSVGEVCAP